MRETLYEWMIISKILLWVNISCLSNGKISVVEGEKNYSTEITVYPFKLLQIDGRFRDQSPFEIGANAISQKGPLYAMRISRGTPKRR